MCYTKHGTLRSRYPDTRYPDTRYPDTRYPDSSLTGQMGFLVIRTPVVRITRSPVNGSPVNGSPDNEFGRGVPVNRTVRITGTECICRRELRKSGISGNA